MSGYDRLHGYVFFSCSSGVFADDADADARKRLADKVEQLRLAGLENTVNQYEMELVVK